MKICRKERTASKKQGSTNDIPATINKNNPVTTKKARTVIRSHQNIFCGKLRNRQYSDIAKKKAKKGVTRNSTQANIKVSNEWQAIKKKPSKKDCTNKEPTKGHGSTNQKHLTTDSSFAIMIDDSFDTGSQEEGVNRGADQ